MECRVEENAQKCSCGNMECERRGICCECLRAHVASRSLPLCMRDLDWVQTIE